MSAAIRETDRAVGALVYAAAVLGGDAEAKSVLVDALNRAAESWSYPGREYEQPDYLMLLATAAAISGDDNKAAAIRLAVNDKLSHVWRIEERAKFGGAAHWSVRLAQKYYGIVDGYFNSQGLPRVKT